MDSSSFFGDILYNLVHILFGLKMIDIIFQFNFFVIIIIITMYYFSRLIPHKKPQSTICTPISTRETPLANRQPTKS
jgi:uncharacterized membrane protein